MSDTIKIKRLHIQDDDFHEQLESHLGCEPGADSQVQQVVEEIVSTVCAEGDAALLKYTNQFDDLALTDMSQAMISVERMSQSLNEISEPQRAALESAAERIRTYHEKQLQSSWSYKEPDGTVLGQKISAISRVGLYVPGGKASYPSSVLMNAIPAKVAGVKELVMVVPTPRGEVNPMVFAAASIAGVDTLFTVGGAQAIAAMAYGTESIPAVDKIVGPGNVYVATAKRQVFGQVGIDMIAGPSEILVICDGKTDPSWIAMDLFSQAEHDENAQAILISDDASFLQAVEDAMNNLLDSMPRKDIIVSSLLNRGLMINVDNLDQAFEICNQIAPEHLELSIESPQEALDKIEHAGAIFMGRHTAEALGDYCAGPNHVLPTSGTARFSSPLGVYDFQKRTSLIHCSESGASELGKIAVTLAESESLVAHAKSAEYRIKK